MQFDINSPLVIKKINSDNTDDLDRESNVSEILDEVGPK